MNDTKTARVKQIEKCHENDVMQIKSTSLLVRFQGRVYDVYNFLNYHPGGKDTLIHFRNKDLNKAFKKYPHSKSAFHLLEEFAVHNQEIYNAHENLVNWDVPILWQVGSMADRYWEWVNLPVNRSIRLFHSEILETLSITPWYILPIVWLPLAIYFFYTGCVINITQNNVVTLQTILPSFTLGILTWTFMEYFIHRRLFHFKSYNSKLLITLHFLFHGHHHKAPLDTRRLVFPPTAGIFLAIIIWQIYKAIFPLKIIYFVIAGTITGYLCYDLTHYYLHNGAPKFGSYLYKMKRKHNYHHFLYPNQGFGITCELWDWIFETNLSLPKLNRPLKW